MSAPATGHVCRIYPIIYLRVLVAVTIHLLFRCSPHPAQHAPNTIDPAAKWLVQKYGGTSVGKFAAKIAENIIP